MGPVAGCEGEEEAVKLRAVDTLRDVFDSFAKQPEGTRGSQQKGHQKRLSRVQVVGVWENGYGVMGGLYGVG